MASPADRWYEDGSSNKTLLEQFVLLETQIRHKPRSSTGLKHFWDRGESKFEGLLQRSPRLKLPINKKVQELPKYI